MISVALVCYPRIIGMIQRDQSDKFQLDQFSASNAIHEVASADEMAPS
jgi:hypothetical protein